MRKYIFCVGVVFTILIVSFFLSCAQTKTGFPEQPNSLPENGEDIQTKATPLPDGDTNTHDRPRITLNWRTESESDNFGFNIYRSESKDGPFKKINREIIPGAGTSGTPHDYTYTDYDVVRLKIYYYYLESVSFEGEKQKFSPIISQQVPPGKQND